MLPPGFYCERVVPGLWSEPCNALSNLGFLFAAAHGWRRLLPAASAAARSGTRLLLVLLALVGLASLSFHTVADGFTQALDVLFIALFNLAYLVLFGRGVLGWPPRWAALAALAFLAQDFVRAALLPAGLLHGSAMYLAPWLVLLALAAAATRVDRAAASRLVQAAGVFLISLTARTLDAPWCAAWPWGLHWLWHLLNAWVLWRLIQAFALAVRPRGQPA